MYGSHPRRPGRRGLARLNGNGNGPGGRGTAGRKEISMESEFKADIQVDATGLYCPMPIIMTAKEIKKIQVGQVLAVKADDEGIQADLPAWCKTTGNELLELTRDGAVFTGYVRKTK
jgi:tRNA 2-thiouridine synthesizing protein A